MQILKSPPSFTNPVLPVFASELSRGCCGWGRGLVLVWLSYVCALGLGELARDVCELNEGIQKGMSFIVTSVVSTSRRRELSSAQKTKTVFQIWGSLPLPMNRWWNLESLGWFWGSRERWPHGEGTLATQRRTSLVSVFLLIFSVTTYFSYKMI